MPTRWIKLLMTPRLESLSEKKLVGRRTLMSFAENKTYELWKNFMPKRKEIPNRLGTDLYSVEVYPPLFFEKFDPAAEFEKWAAVEVTGFENVPQAMETLVVPAGRYAVFIHKGPAGDGPKTYGYIFNSWLPNSEFLLDARPHFAVMGNKYRQDDKDSEEEIWIPVRPKL